MARRPAKYLQMDWSAGVEIQERPPSWNCLTLGSVVSPRWLHSTMVPGRKYSTAMRIDDQPRNGLQGSIGRYNCRKVTGDRLNLPAVIVSNRSRALFVLNQAGPLYS